MKKIIVVVLAVFACHSVLADKAIDTNQWNQHKGVYAAFNLGTNAYYTFIGSTDVSGEHAGATGFGWSGAVGYNFTPVYSLEGGFMQNYGTWHNDDGGKVRAHTNVPYIANKFTIGIGDKWAFLTKIGLMYINASGTSTDKDGNASGSTPGFILPFVGLGGSYAVMRNLDVDVQYQGAVYGIAGAGLLSAGVTYHF